MTQAPTTAVVSHHYLPRIVDYVFKGERLYLSATYSCINVYITLNLCGKFFCYIFHHSREITLESSDKQLPWTLRSTLEARDVIANTDMLLTVLFEEKFVFGVSNPIRKTLDEKARYLKETHRSVYTAVVARDRTRFSFRNF